jgi:hypothetical protein
VYGRIRLKSVLYKVKISYEMDSAGLNYERRGFSTRNETSNSIKSDEIAERLLASQG